MIGILFEQSHLSRSAYLWFLCDTLGLCLVPTLDFLYHSHGVRESAFALVLP